MSTTVRPRDGHGLDAVLGRGRRAFRRRVALGAGLAVAVLVAVGSALAWRQYEDGKREALNELRARVILASTVFDTYFAGQIAVLQSIAKSPAVVATDTDAMRAYFARVQPAKGTLFTGGLGWIDRGGTMRVTTATSAGSRLDVSDRSFFRRVMASGKPFISEGVTARVTGRRVVVMAVPTRDAGGRLTGVLAGGLELRPSRNDQRATDLGYEGLVVVDRAGQQLTLKSLARPKNIELVADLRKGEGVFQGTGLEGEGDRVVAYANSKAPGWTTVLDRSRSDVFGAARRSLGLELASIFIATLAVLAIIGWAIVRSQRDLEAERQQLRHWEDLSRALGDASASAEVSGALGAALATSFPRATVVVGLEADDRQGLALSVVAPGGEAQTFDADDAPDVAAIAGLAYVAGTPVALEDAEAIRAAVDGARGSLLLSAGTLYGVPLTRAGRTIGSVTLVLGEGDLLEDTERALVEAHADNAAHALARARRTEREHDTAVALQRSLLPDSLPAVDGVDLAGRYAAGGVGLEIGGDWYDAVRRPDGVVHLTVGDVAGRGIPAAVLMGQLRNTFRALAYEHVSPAEIANRMLRHVPRGAMATAVFLTLDPYTQELAYASAGHPPTLLLDGATGTVTPLDGVGAPPLGWASDESIREERISLTGSATLLAYTDGLVERRGESIDRGIDRLGALLRSATSLPAEAAAGEVLRESTSPITAPDDIAVLLVRLDGPPAQLRIELPADPAAMRRLRARLGTWLRLRGLDDEERADTILAVTEACNNAIEHGYREGDGTIDVTVEHEDGRLQVTIEDQGRWKPPRPDPTRGRGMTIMNGTMDTATVAPGRAGTRVHLERRLRRRSPVA